MAATPLVREKLKIPHSTPARGMQRTTVLGYTECVYYTINRRDRKVQTPASHPRLHGRSEYQPQAAPPSTLRGDRKEGLQAYGSRV